MNAATWLTLQWVAFYTRGLGLDVRREREDEIRSDLWEQLAADGACVRTQLAIGSRCLLGVPSDLSWRRRERRQARGRLPVRHVAWHWGQRGLFGGACLQLLAFHGWGAMPVVGVYPVDMETWPNVGVYSAVSAGLGGALVLGLALLTWRPRTGAAFATVAAVGTLAYHYWALFMFGPAAAIIVTGAIRRTRRS